jgi:general transcription factor 3C polypeptide 5 (transcription factor C subunit 1)
MDTPLSIATKVPEAECVAVEYPGFVRNVDAALRTLGGTESVSTAACSSTGCLKLNFRPSEPTAHPVYGETLGSCRLLLRVSRARQGSTRRVHSHAANQDAASSSVKAEVVARIPQTIRFQGLSDFQFVPMDQDLVSR